MTALSETFLGGAVIGASAGLTNGLISGYGFARLGGSSVGQALLSGLKSGAIGLASGAIIGGATQGISNVYHGRNFWTGKPSVSAASVANSASSTSNQPADMTLDEYAAQYNETNSIQVKDYHPRLSNKTYTYHNFPRMIEDKVIKYGIPSQRINDAAYWFEYNGSVNGVDGFFTIGINKDGVLFHRCFYPK